MNSSSSETLRSRPVALITGSSSGFGLQTSIALAQHGYKVIASMRSVEKQGRLQEQAHLAGVSEHIHVFSLDVTQVDSIERAIKTIMDHFGSIDIVVNNAGCVIGGFVEEVDRQGWYDQMETNFFGTVAVTQAVLPIMRQQRYGKIINISSVSGLSGYPGYAPYASSKFAVEGFTESLRLEMLPYGVYAVLVEPGPYQTDIWDKAMKVVHAPEHSPYRAQIDAVLRFSQQTAKQAPPATEVAQCIVRIAGMSKPKLRYLLGKEAKIGQLLRRILPWKWYERILLKVLSR
ncbi:SDR family oxidoreductase [Paenibacillus sp. 481]|uniref:SDR family oxidoreductase n=1 Tax=Paenibacillus sp. 481 TaxID=2835869 RepID=UPI001E31D12B|nr:SDR family oxidoreductase [Paenibacillus sp. 481]UHA75529.1 SDR family oxidoreductase [Paenibacillus sp. 481]